MDLIKSIDFNEYYFNIYNDILKEENDIILSINQNIYNILDSHNHLIKKLNLKIYILSNDEESEKILNNIVNDDDCLNNINIIRNIDTDASLLTIFNKIIIFQINSLQNLENILEKSLICSNFDTEINIYCSLSNEKLKKINYKNQLRYYVNNLLKKNIGYVLSFTDVVYKIDEIKNEHIKFKIDSIDVFQKNNYIIYGDNIIYHTKLKCIEIKNL